MIVCSKGPLAVYLVVDLWESAVLEQDHLDETQMPGTTQLGILFQFEWVLASKRRVVSFLLKLSLLFSENLTLAFFRKGLNFFEHVDVGYMLLVMIQEELKKLEELQGEREWSD